MKNESYPRVKYELRPSKLIPGQVGLFSLINFKKGDVIIEDSNWDESRLITWDEFGTIESPTKDKLIDFCYKTKEGVYAPQDINRINIGYFMNHSCNPLVYCNEKGDYVATRDISIGDEFTIDVEKLMEKPIFSFECHCGAENCRKIVKI